MGGEYLEFVFFFLVSGASTREDTSFVQKKQILTQVCLTAGPSP